ncbi:hypothetical protein TWF225_000111 [Orbilia oligospora]|nr:hypothetical protein TWF225_000111 [Orbilia oligospora]KAF3256675.1 hypothetical protein TWF128_005194 [Orbilia oligospora]KAF3261429.1 hypothetical protein TWF217_004570 [Orbilia oligospora]KAF3294261.1 hypothetical protein TWF132_003689 [Orbilia oligospora]
MANQAHYPSTHLTESAGCVLFHLPTRKICLLSITVQNANRGILITLPKGRRNINETRKEAAVRETAEETSYKCSLLPVKMGTRLTLPEDDEDVRDRVRQCDACTESFHMQLRSIGRKEERRAKIVWWFIAQVDEEDYERKEEVGWDGKVKEGVRVEWKEYEDVIGELSYETDVEVVKTAWRILEATEGPRTRLSGS